MEWKHIEQIDIMLSQKVLSRAQEIILYLHILLNLYELLLVSRRVLFCFAVSQ